MLINMCVAIGIICASSVGLHEPLKNGILHIGNNLFVLAHMQWAKARN